MSNRLKRNYYHIFIMMKCVLLLVFLAEIFSSTPTIKPKLCCDCKFFIKDFMTMNKFGKCALFPKDHEGDNMDYLVDGVKSKADLTYCSIARRYANMCGPEGAFYEQK